MSSNKSYITKIKQDYSVKDGYFQYIELPDDLIKELGWHEGMYVEMSVKLGPNDNVIVVTKSK